MDDLKPCPFRLVDDEGNILCDKVKAGDRLVTAHVCRACPVAEINCEHLRAALNRQNRVPILVRYGNGKTRVWDDHLPAISLNHAACAIKVMPITSPHDCAGCALHRPLQIRETAALPAAGIPVLAARGTSRRSRRAPLATHPIVARAGAIAGVDRVAAVLAPGARAEIIQVERANSAGSNSPAGELDGSDAVTQKVIHLAEWLAGQRRVEPDRYPDTERETKTACAVSGSNPRRWPLEEKRTGWTD